MKYEYYWRGYGNGGNPPPILQRELPQAPCVGRQVGPEDVYSVATQEFEETGGWIMEKGKKLFSILFRVLSTLFVAGASYVALAGTFGIGKVWRCVLLLLPGPCSTKMRFASFGITGERGRHWIGRRPRWCLYSLLRSHMWCAAWQSVYLDKNDSQKADT